MLSSKDTESGKIFKLLTASLLDCLYFSNIKSEKKITLSLNLTRDSCHDGEVFLEGRKMMDRLELMNYSSKMRRGNPQGFQWL